MAGFKDKTFCVSPNCKNECGRAMTFEEKEKLKELAFRGFADSSLVSCAYFCGETDALIDERTKNE